MANVYGVANLGLINSEPGLGGADLNCPAGVETNVLSATLKGSDASGVYIPYVSWNLWVALGATPPTQLVIGVRIGAGADFNFVQYPIPLLVANANIVWTGSFLGGPSIVPWQGAGSVVNLTLAPVTQAVTAKHIVCYADFLLFRAPDQ